MSRIHYTVEAEDDLTDIKEYIAVQLENPIAALNTVTRIAQRIRKLEKFPKLGTRLNAITDINTDYRFLVCANYLAFYRIGDDEVHIIRILYGRRDYAAILFGKLQQDGIE